MLCNIHIESYCSIGGDRFTELREQKGLEMILLRTEQLHGWPTSAAQEQLKQAWAWV
jgi:hypothetical protein